MASKITNQLAVSDEYTRYEKMVIFPIIASFVGNKIQK